MRYLCGEVSEGLGLGMGGSIKTYIYCVVGRKVRVQSMRVLCYA